MATSPLGGSSSVLDVASIVSSLMQIERKPLNAIESKISEKNVEISAVGTLKAKASALETALKNLETPANISAPVVESSDSSLVTAEATSSADVGSIQVQVMSTALATRVTAGGFTSATAAVGNGTLTLEVGQYTEDSGTTNFTASTTKAITVPEGATLTDLKDLINNADAGVTANIVQTGSSYNLVVTGKNTGLENAIRLSSSDAQNLPGGSTPDFTSITYSQATGETSSASVLQSARNAVVYLDGLRVERASNTIADAIPGVTFQLRKPTSLTDLTQATSVSISVSEKPGQLRTALDSVVTAYNDFYRTFSSLSAPSVDSNRRGALNSDVGMRALVSSVRDAFAQGLNYSASDGNGGTTTTNVPFWKLGVELQRDGTLAIDETQFSTALTDGTADAFKEGVTVVAKSVLSDALAYNGTFDTRTQGAKDTQQALQKRKLDFQDRLDIVETNYRKRYAALDATLAQLNGLNSAVQQLLGQLNSQNNG